MSEPAFASHLRGPIRLRTLTTLRWLAVAGQTVAILLVHFGLGYEVPLGICLSTIAASAWLNIFSVLKYSPQRMLSDREAAFYIGFDILQLGALLFFTGGLQNPFSALLLAPVTIAASVLPLRQMILIAALALLGLALLAVFHMPLPWSSQAGFSVPSIYIAGVWTALSFSVVFFAAYAHRIAAESAQMRSALTATQLVLSREERLSALGGLAAAAAHELGTPLATIQVTAQEMAEEMAEPGDRRDNDLLKEDAALLISQAKRCRDILGRLSNRGEEGDVMHNRVRLDSLLKEAASPFVSQPDGPEIIFEVSQATSNGLQSLETLPFFARRPEIIYGLRNFIENAFGFAQSQVFVRAVLDEKHVTVSVIDDGPGFSPDALARLGEPYINPKQSLPRNKGHKAGMGLGFFIAKTLLERTKATVQFQNLWQEKPSRRQKNLIEDAEGERGALVQVQWVKSDLLQEWDLEAQSS